MSQLFTDEEIRWIERVWPSVHPSLGELDEVTRDELAAWARISLPRLLAEIRGNRARIQQLLEANNREVERRREAEEKASATEQLLGRVIDTARGSRQQSGDIASGDIAIGLQVFVTVCERCGYRSFFNSTNPPKNPVCPNCRVPERQENGL